MIRLSRFRTKRVIALLLVGAVLALFAWIAMRPAGIEPRAKPMHAGKLTQQAAVETTLPPVPQARNLEVSKEEAQAINAGIALSTAPLEIARPFSMETGRASNDPASLEQYNSRAMAVDCLTAAIFYEAASEGMQGQRAVAQVVLNRVRHPAFPKSVCGVVYQGMERRTGCQFTFSCDGSLARKPSQAGWQRARQVAIAALNGIVEPSVGTATHYHTIWVVPYWATSLDKIGVIGAHIFYRWKGYWGLRAAFAGRYVGEGSVVPPLVGPYDELPELAQKSMATDAAIRPLADQLAPITPSAKLAVPVAPKLRADENRGTLLADKPSALLEGSASRKP